MISLANNDLLKFSSCLPHLFHELLHLLDSARHSCSCLFSFQFQQVVVVALVAAVVLADIAHQGLGSTGLLQAGELHDVGGVVAANRLLSGFLRQRDPAVLGQSSSRMGQLRALFTEVCATDGAVDNSNVLLNLVAGHGELSLPLKELR